jgi:CheY-like chemotaxis protein
MSAPVRILIADDHAAFRGMLRSMLRSFGAEVLECRDGREAVEQCGEFAPDWVLMDIEMPQLDGLAATRRLTMASPGARVIILTQHDDEESRDAAREAGACQFVPKDSLERLPVILFPGWGNTGVSSTNHTSPSV